ncbi:hypothetical protein [Paraburkholderia tropica]|uniref:hypothetical protein n=1 Tax=Paraburkholderia tropica TaxID=92647 RepID=UPI00159224A8|nr:hypothetical protein [Paraburkholderia tropica]
MRLADNLERRLLGTARVLCIVALVGAVLAMMAVIAALSASGNANVSADPPVSASAVLASIPGTEAANDAISNNNVNSANDDEATLELPAAAGLALPAPLRAVLDQHNASQPMLDAWLDNVPLADRQQFVDELGQVIAHATHHASAWEWDDRDRYVATAMNQYARFKIERIASAQSLIEAAQARSAQFRSSLGTLLALAGFLTVLLLLLAIERNTRALRTPQNG